MVENNRSDYDGDDASVLAVTNEAETVLEILNGRPVRRCDVEMKIGVYVLTRDVENPERVDMRRGGRSHGAGGRRAGNNWLWAPTMKKGTTVYVEHDEQLELDGDRRFFLRPANGREKVGEKRPWFRAVWPHLKWNPNPSLEQVLAVTHMTGSDVVTKLLKSEIVTRDQLLELVGWPKDDSAQQDSGHRF